MYQYFHIILLLFSFTIYPFHSFSQDYDFDEWDENQNDLIELSEFTEHFDDWDFEDWDSNGDEIIDMAEWVANAAPNYSEENVFQSFDLNNDGYLNESEYKKGTFNRWDVDENEVLSRVEFDAFVYAQSTQ